MDRPGKPRPPRAAGSPQAAELPRAAELPHAAESPRAADSPRGAGGGLRQLTAERLTADFGADSALAQTAVRALVAVISTEPVASAACARWQLGQAGGEELAVADPRLALLAAHYGVAPTAAAPLLFAVHTYYAVLLKFLAAERVAAAGGGSLVRRCADTGSAAALRQVLTAWEDEADGRRAPLGSACFAAGEPFTFYLAAWQPAIADWLRRVAQTLAAYDQPALGDPSGGPHDLLKQLYQHLFPKSVRHRLGEYYTPDWLAEFTLDAVGYTGDPDQRLLDPACGSGTFLVQALARARARFAAHRERGVEVDDERELAGKLVRNIVGLDINPLAVMAARTNYLLALGDLLRFIDPGALPVHLGDALLPGAADSRRGASLRDALGRFDYVVGNPPWINWEALPEPYRQQTAHLFRDYELLTLRGWKARVAAGRTDLSVLFVVICLDKYVKPSGLLCFVLTQSIFKSVGGGAGFRRFRLPHGSFAPLKVHDFSAAAIFPDAVTRATVSVFQRDRSCTYPVPYFRWVPNRKGLLAPRRARELTAACTPEPLGAIPASPGEPGSPWLTGAPASLRAMTKLLGASAYRAREGINWGGALGVFQLAAAQLTAPGRCTIHNDGTAGRLKVDCHTATVEAALVYPLIKGRDVQRWRAAVGRSVLLSHPAGPAAARPFPLPAMQRRYPRALAYFTRFEQRLQARKEYQRWGGTAPFYELYRIGPYTFAPYKVVFKDLSEIFQCCVVHTAGPHRRVVIPDYTLRMIPFQTAAEAYFVAGLLNSGPARLALHASSVGVQTQRYHAGDIDKLALPRYAPAHRGHRAVATLSRQCHAAAAGARLAELPALEARLDAAVAELWGLSAPELAQLQSDFTALTGPDSAAGPALS